MKRFFYVIMIPMILITLITLATKNAVADTSPQDATTTTYTPGWGPSVVGSVGAFYFNGNYSLLSAGVNVGTAYTWNQASNVNSVGIYLGPQSQQIQGVTSTSLNLMVYANLYKTAAAGSFGVGLGTRLWQSGMGMDRAVGCSTTYLALGYQF